MDYLSGRKFLVDTGASISVFPQSTLTTSAPSYSVRILTAGRSPLSCFGTCSIPLRFGSRKFSWSFQLSPVSLPILGLDFLRHHALQVDVARAHVLDADSLDVLSTISSPSALDLFWLTSSLLRERSGIFSLSIQMSCPQMGFQPLLRSMAFFTISLRSLALLYLPRPAVWTQTRLPLLKLSSSRWKRLALYANPPCPGPVFFTWSLNLMGPGDLVGTSAASSLPQSLTVPSTCRFQFLRQNFRIQVLLQT